MARRLTNAALLIGAALFLPALALLNSVPATPQQQRYCQPLIYRDQFLVVGYQAVIRAAPGCDRPSLLRKESLFTDSVLNTYLVPTGEVKRVWLFTHRLTYTLDGQTWRRAVIR